MTKPIPKWTRKEFLALPFRNSWSKSEVFHSLVILPRRRHHESGYRLIDFVGCRGDEPICRLSGCSDVLHFNGIGGYGENWADKYQGVPTHVPVMAWNMDFLPVSGLARIWCSSHHIKVGSALSSFEIFAVPREEKK